MINDFNPNEILHNQQFQDLHVEFILAELRPEITALLYWDFLILTTTLLATSKMLCHG